MHATPPSRLVTGVDHYENFPVASVLVPGALRPAMVALYRFARYADDVADEGDAAPHERLAELDRLAAALRADGSTAAAGDHPVVAALRPHLASRNLSRADCLALLSAFRQDVSVSRYRDFAELRDYCRRSADPVGHLVLELFGCRSPRSEPLADAICTALQLINFLQDVSIDWQRGRLYLPLDSLASEGLDERAVDAAVRAGVAAPALRRCIAAEAIRAGALLESGAPLLSLVPRRLAWELRATLAGARRILELLDAGGHDPIAHRPRLRWRDAPALLRLMHSPPRVR
ncbi:MAG TPA: squalene synthase HpnC [Quisquiliibacterium sp.]|nr:squalene synthase HpnC [Quisquiliibacterium sp.]